MCVLRTTNRMDFMCLENDSRKEAASGLSLEVGEERRGGFEKGNKGKK